ncbi:MAG: hypothetical protein JWO86_1737 [Myxococcaceae bacterium]|nr:hypothetical protein [Myxococcaceae bacterium]
MSTPLLALDCPKCGAQLGPPGEGGAYVCSHCGEHSRAKVEVQIQRVIGAQKQFNVIATQQEIDERRREFERVATVDRAFLAARDQRRKAADNGKTVAVVLAIAVLVLGALLAVALLVARSR